MTSFVPALSLFAIPLLLSGVAQKHKGLITGLFIALYLLSRVHPLLSLVPLSCAAYLFMVTKHRIPKGKVRRKFRNPALPLFMVFLLTMGIFCAFGESVVGYGQTLRLPPRILSAGNSAVALACLIGPVAIGNRCDKKGLFCRCSPDHAQRHLRLADGGRSDGAYVFYLEHVQHLFLHFRVLRSHALACVCFFRRTGFPSYLSGACPASCSAVANVSARRAQKLERLLSVRGISGQSAMPLCFFGDFSLSFLEKTSVPDHRKRLTMNSASRRK